jgi:hypothetical protein
MAEERVIQVFCDICSRGVLIWKESMYKCQRCGKQVCHTCFDTSLKQCLECARPVREAEELNRVIATQATVEEHRVLERRLKLQRMWTSILSIIAILAGAAVVTYFLLNSNFRLQAPSLPAGRSSQGQDR